MPDKIKSSWPQHVATHTQCWLTGIFYWKTRHSKLAFDSFMFVTLPYSYYMYIERTMYVHNLIVFIFCFVSVSIRKWPNVYCSIYIYIYPIYDGDDNQQWVMWVCKMCIKSIVWHKTTNYRNIVKNVFVSFSNVDNNLLSTFQMLVERRPLDPAI